MGSDEEVPSPTFALVQPYSSARFPIAHFDFYRLTDPAEAGELGVEDALANGVVIAEWPRRVGPTLPGDRLELRLEDGDSASLRHAPLTGHGQWTPRLERLAASQNFLKRAGWEGAQPSYVNGDASARSYTRLAAPGKTAMLMDWPKASDGPPIRGNRPYSRIANLAEEVKPFVAIAGALAEAGLAAPAIYASDLDRGFLLIEDFGDAVFTRLAAEDADMLPLYRMAVDVLLALRGVPLPQSLSVSGGAHTVPAYDGEALSIETELLVDWFLPAVSGTDTAPAVRERYAALWGEQFDWLLRQPSGWVLRDFHSPNLIYRRDREGLGRIGILDFQDAVRGHPAYDLVSLLQDARLDLPAGLEEELFAYYCERASSSDPAFDILAFTRAYQLLGAQRNTKILGIFARLARRDGKRAYLQHMPRVARYLAGDLAHPDLAALQNWYESVLPGDIASLASRF